MSGVSSDGLGRRVTEIREFLLRNEGNAESTDVGIVSSFWTQVFAGRPNYPSLNDILVLRRSQYLYGIGESRQEGEAAERDYFDRIAYIFEGSVPREFVHSIEESAFGAPYVFDYDGRPRSAGFILNSATAWHVVSQVRASGLEGHSIDLCEIGPGWGGCAYQLHSVLPLKSCTLIDLPQNLFMSSSYLSAVLPERRLNLIDTHGPALGSVDENSINAVLPAGALRLHKQFDLIVNSFSLQEMELSTVRAYVEWIHSHLAQNGLFISINSHGKAGVRKPSDYGFDRFRIRSIRTFRRYPVGLFNTIPYAACLSLRSASDPVYSGNFLNALGQLIQFGLDGVLKEIEENYILGELDTNQRFLLELCDQLFQAHDDNARLSLLGQMYSTRFGALVGFLEGSLLFAMGEVKEALSRLQAAADAGLDDFALAKAHLMALSTGHAIQAKMPFDPRRAYPEATIMATRRDPAPLVSHINVLFSRRMGSINTLVTRLKSKLR